MDGNPAIAVHPTCCRNGPDAARQGHLACLQSLHKQGNFLGFHDKRRTGAGEVQKAQTWLAALAACDGRQSDILSWLLAEGWPLSEAERLPWHFRDMADPSNLTWYTEGRPYNAQSFPFPRSSPVDVTAVDWNRPGEWSEMAHLAGLHDSQSEALVHHKFNGSLWGQSGACEAWFPQEFQVLWRACRSGDLACQQIIVEAGCRSPWVTVLAALTGQLEFLEFSIEQGCPWEGSTLVAAAAGGHVESFMHIMKTCLDTVDTTLFKLQKDPRGQDFSPQWFFSKRFQLDYRQRAWPRELDVSFDRWIAKAALCAAENGHLEVLKCIHTRKTQSVWRQAGLPNPASAAISHGRLSCLEFTYKHNCKPSPLSVQVALLAGHADCVSYLMSRGLKMDASFAFHAAQGGQLELLELLAARGTLRCEDAARGASTGGQVACLRLALENSTIEDPGALLLRSAIGEHAACMRYLHEKGFTAPEGTLSAAVKSGSLQCLECAFEIGCQEDLTGLMVHAAGHDVALVQCLHERGCPWEKGTTQAAARRGCLATLQYCHGHGCSWDPEVNEAAILADSAACLEYIHTHDCPAPPCPYPQAYNLEVLQYAVDNMGDFGAGLLLATSTQLQLKSEHQYADWRLLTYMSQKKMALPHVLQRAVEQRRGRLSAVVSCFHLATHLADQGGPHAPKWAVMGWIPHVLLENITELAHLRLRKRRAGEQRHTSACLKL